MKAILARKIGMTRIFEENGDTQSVTVLAAGPCMVTYAENLSDEKGSNVQLGFEDAKEKHLTKPERGHLKNTGMFRILRSFRIPKGAEAPAQGSTIDVSAFSVGDTVRVVGTSKGKGFQGVVRRHHFAGGPASHGGRHNLRAPGSIGCAYPQKVLKGRRMAGRMGGNRTTTKGLRVVDILPEEHLIVLSGAVPGARGSLVEIHGEEKQ